MRQVLKVLGCSALLLLTGCGEQTPLTTEPEAPDALETARGEIAAFEAEMKALENELSAPGKRGNAVVLSAGSVDGLAAAIAQAGPGGTVLVQSGMHVESGPVTISETVKILGEPGAVLQIDTGPWPTELAYVQPALYVLNATHVVIWGVDVRPPPGTMGGAAILVEDSPHTVVGESVIEAHQFGVVVHGGDHARIWKNRISTVGLDTGLLTNGVLVTVGSHARVVGNEASNALIGIFVSDEEGLLAHNRAHENFIGFVLCKERGHPGPGSELKAEQAANGWKAVGNNGHDNLNAGYLVIDGAHNNLLAHNAAANNGTYDIELTGDTYRFGFLAPFAFENRVTVGPFRDLTVKDCGVNNRIVGGIRIDTAVDPCL